MELLQETLSEFTVQAMDILTNKNESANQRKTILALFQYWTVPHSSEGISVFNLFEIISSSEKCYFYSDPIITSDCNKFLTVTKLMFEINLNCEMKQNLVQYIIQHIKVLPSEELKLILFEQWSKNRLVYLSSEILESVICEVHLCLEESILRLAETVSISSVDYDNIFINLNRNDIKSIIDLSTKSSVIFQNSLSILHELLILSNAHKNILLLVSAFVSVVIERCKLGIVHLFPLELHDLVIILQRNPNQLDCFTRQIVLKRIYGSLKINQSASTALITYFPKWLPHILGDSSINIEKKHWVIFLQIIQAGTIIYKEFIK